jgi:hypothetical protein
MREREREREREVKIEGERNLRTYFAFNVYERLYQNITRKSHGFELISHFSDAPRNGIEVIIPKRSLEM